MDIKVILALTSKMIEERIEKEILSVTSSSLRGPRGLPGPRGEDGKDFSLDEHSDTIKSWIKDYSLKFSDLTEEEIASLRGPKGLPGKDGKDGESFSWNDHSEKIYNFCKEYILSEKDLFTIKFSDLTSEEISQLRGPRGQKGKAGKNFSMDEHREEISGLLRDLVNSSKEDLKLKFSHLAEGEVETLKLKFSDLTSEEISQLRGPRGQRGKPGRDFSMDEHREEIFDQISEEVTSQRDHLKLNFSDLTESEKDSLKLKFKDLSLEDRKSIQGARGVPGLKGDPGINGLDGQDAPYVTDVRVDQWNKEFRFIFEFSDGSEIVTNFVSIPESSKFLISSGGGGGGGGGGGIGTPGADGSQYYFGAGIPSNLLYNDGDIYQDTDNGDQYKKISGVWVWQDNLTGPQAPDLSNQLITGIPCETSVYPGAAVYMKKSPLTTSYMSEWPNLAAVTSLDVSSYISIADNALADSYETSNVIGLVESKQSPGLCTIRVAGVTAENYYSLDVVEEYYLSDTIPGALVKTADSPTASGHVLLRIGQPVGISKLLYTRGERLVRA